MSPQQFDYQTKLSPRNYFSPITDYFNEKIFQLILRVLNEKCISHRLRLKRKLYAFQRGVPVKNNPVMFELSHRLTNLQEPYISEQLHSVNTCVCAGSVRKGQLQLPPLIRLGSRSRMRTQTRKE